MVKLLLPIFALIFVTIPFVLASLPVILSVTVGEKLIGAASFPIIFLFQFLLITGLFSLPFHKSIKNGKFPRDLSDSTYGSRRLYGLCWTWVFYSGPIYFICLTFKPLKWILLRSFGYKGSLDFTIYPDTWIRDWPILDFGQGAYVANKSSLGSNLCLSNGQILVEGIRMGEGAMLGHLGILGPGVQIGSFAELGTSVVAGIRVRVEAKAKVGSCSALNHGAVIGAGAEIGANSYIGLKAYVANGIKIPSGSNIPAGMEVTTQEQAGSIYSSETESLNELRRSLSAGLASGQLPGLKVASGSDDSHTGAI